MQLLEIERDFVTPREIMRKQIHPESENRRELHIFAETSSQTPKRYFGRMDHLFYKPSTQFEQNNKPIVRRLWKSPSTGFHDLFASGVRLCGPRNWGSDCIWIRRYERLQKLSKALHGTRLYAFTTIHKVGSSTMKFFWITVQLSLSYLLLNNSALSKQEMNRSSRQERSVSLGRLDLSRVSLCVPYSGMSNRRRQLYHLLQHPRGYHSLTLLTLAA